MNTKTYRPRKVKKMQIWKLCLTDEDRESVEIIGGPEAVRHLIRKERKRVDRPAKVYESKP